MAKTAEPEPEPEALWEQGSLIPGGAALSPLHWVHPDNPTSKTARGFIRNARHRGEQLTGPVPVATPAKANDRLMVITQSCDIIKPPNEMPQIELARVFATTNERMIAQAQDFGSARFFRVNDLADETALILDYGLRALIDKGFLDLLTPDNAALETLTSERRQTFARWLGQRYSRPAVPDEDYPLITGPIRDAWKELLEDEPKVGRRFNAEYAEWRYRREADGNLTLYILSSENEPDEGDRSGGH